MMKLGVFLVLLLAGTASTYQNVALRGRASQVDRFHSMAAAANLAIDGNSNSILRKGSCTYTAGSTNPWWRVDLLDRYVVTSIAITNRGDCCQEKLNGLQIRVGDALSSYSFENPKVGSLLEPGAGERVVVNFTETVKGRYVVLVLPGEARSLQICEVEVFGYRAPTGENLALQGKASQSSLHMFAFAFNAVDGNRNGKLARGSCSQTANETSPWWRLDLRKTHKVFSVKIANQESFPESLNGAEILVGDSLENEGNSNPRLAVISSIEAGGVAEFTSDGMDGRYVNIVIRDRQEMLTLCEVEVYGSVLD